MRRRNNKETAMPLPKLKTELYLSPSREPRLLSFGRDRQRST